MNDLKYEQLSPLYITAKSDGNHSFDMLLKYDMKENFKTVDMSKGAKTQQGLVIDILGLVFCTTTTKCIPSLYAILLTFCWLGYRPGGNPEI